MATRLDLHAILIDALGSEHVYFQPPPGLDMHYPCIIYRRDQADTEFANNEPYSHKKRYLVTVVDRDPDSPIPGRVATIRTCVFDRYYAAEGLNHDVYKLFYWETFAGGPSAGGGID